MSYFKCRDCAHFIEDAHKGLFLRYSKCSVSDEIAYGSSSPCGSFASTEYTCGQCSHFRDSGRCTYKAAFFGLVGGGKHSKDKPACGDFSPGCFLTSACVEYKGKPDDCKELTALRLFRDTYMKSVKNGQKLIDEYYKIAPEIVERINNSELKNTYYEYIYSVIERCVDLLSHESNEETLKEYMTMVLKLKSELL
ncbi:MAG: hypothetical protein K2M75_00775 [Clostridia bacterium]|nr:hypothetical protein [Clostridia bacterium]